MPIVCRGDPRKRGKRRICSFHEPAPCVQAGGIAGLRPEQVDIVCAPFDDIRQGEISPKPPYRVPSVAEIRAASRNGRTVVSTFSGCGGSCLGFEMAGFEVRWASEFVPAAAVCHRLNFPACALDARDLRGVAPEEILAAVGREPGEVDVLEGSPPCQSFSTVGRLQAGWGRVASHGDGSRQRSDDLFFEFARILAGVRPKAFVAENVAGLVKGVSKGYFLEILAALQAAGYRVRARVLDAQWLGVPQRRERVIFVGIREDLGVEPEHPAPLPYRYSLAEACPWIIEQRRIFHDEDGKWSRGDVTNQPAPCIRASCSWALFVEPGPDDLSPTVTARGRSVSAAGVALPTERRKFSIQEMKCVCGFPDDFVLVGSYTQQWARLGNAVPPPMMAAVARKVAEVLDRAEGNAGGKQPPR